MYGPEMISIIKKFHFDCAFISAEAFVSGRGFFDPHEDSVAVKRALIEASDTTIVMIDSSKALAGTGICICENSEVDIVVTDDPDKSPLKKVFKDKLI
jgi:DeoR/GlpR family transcriptional regulator of sugar metabolism